MKLTKEIVKLLMTKESHREKEEKTINKEESKNNKQK